MATTYTEAASGLYGTSRAARPREAAGPGGDWPNTTRILPWVIAGFLAMLWLVPVDATTAPIPLPISSHIDRFALCAAVLVWLAVAAAAGSYGPSRRRSAINVAVLAFLLVSTASVILNIGTVVHAEELDLALDNLAKAISYAALFLVVATVVRKREIPRFAVLISVLACVTAIGTVIQYRTGTNYFYELSGKLLPGFHVGVEPPSPKVGRPLITGPTQHALALATLFAMAIPFATVGLMMAKERTRKLLWGLALAIMFAGAAATLRRTAFVAPLAALIPLVIYRPREMAKLLPVGFVLLLTVVTIAPGAVQGISDEVFGHNEFRSESQISTQGRTSDYAAVTPDILSHPLIGRGVGTYDPNSWKTKQIPTHHRFIDNQYLKLLLETGVLGLIAYLGLGLTGIAALNRSARSRDPARAGPALSIIGAISVFLVASAIFDDMFFVQVPYLLFFLLGLGVVVATDDERSEPERPWSSILDRGLELIRRAALEGIQLQPPAADPHPRRRGA